MRMTGWFVAVGTLVALGLASCLPAMSGPSAAGHPANVVTWSETIAPIVQQHCQGCHHPGDIAPFPW
jgi:mono/diheme cytochrome c family protein